MIADRKDGDRGQAPRHERAAVRERRTGRELPHRHDARREAHRGREPFAGETLGRSDPVEREPRTHGAEEGLGVAQHAGGVRQVNEPRLEAGGGQRGDAVGEAADLARRGRRARILRCRELREDAAHGQP